MWLNAIRRTMVTNCIKPRQWSMVLHTISAFQQQHSKSEKLLAQYQALYQFVGVTAIKKEKKENKRVHKLYFAIWVRIKSLFMWRRKHAQQKELLTLKTKMAVWLSYTIFYQASKAINMFLSQVFFGYVSLNPPSKHKDEWNHHF